MKGPIVREKDLLLGALECDSAELRSAFLDEACGEDDGLRRRIEALIDAHERPEDLLDRAAVDVRIPSDDTTAAADSLLMADCLGTAIGPYTLVETIGEGGMGMVYRAEQAHPVRRTVALKIIKPGMDTRQVIARFEAERQVLAMMEHAHIARVLDAGATDTGRPYFVMDLVKGVSITTYCDTARLSSRARLELFVPVCQAIQHAHQKGIIHRDIKPSNVLITMVDGKPVPRVIDFGVAKAIDQRLTEQTMLTQHGTILGTLEYMSPEQAELSRDIDTRSDIYSLGVLMYELLTSSTPLEREKIHQASYSEFLRQLREEEPPKPSARLSDSGDRLGSLAAMRRTEPARLTKQVRGELDWIVMKAIDKDRTRRYETAGDLARDVERYINNGPVEAGPPSAWYRLRKYGRRHRVALTTTAVFAATLVAGTTISIWQAVRARHAAESAVFQRNRALVAESAANAQARASQRESMLQQILRILSMGHRHGWSDVAAARIQEAARLGPDADRRLQGYAAASLLGLDARLIQSIPIETSTLAFDPGGKTLYLGDNKGQVRIWDGAVNPVRKVGTPGTGLIAFQPNGTSARFLSRSKDDPSAIELRALETSRTLRRFTSPLGPDSRFEAITLTSNCPLVAATCLIRDKGFAVVWNAETGDIVRQVEVTGPTCLCLAPDGRWLAVGTKEGEVVVWPLPEGDPLLRFTAGRVAITALAFGPDRLRRARPGKPAGSWLLAVGDAATGLSVLELGTQSIRSRCRGSNNDLRALAFSPDGMLLASTGRDNPIVWDIATGQPILQLEHHNTATSIAFSSDGKLVAVGSRNAYGSAGRVDVYELENDRGLQTLRGLDAAIEKPIFSSDGRYIAALSQDFRVAIWDRLAGQLLHVLEVPIGVHADNAGLALSPDGRRFAYAAGTQARVWDVKTGDLLKTWTLPEAFQDDLAFGDADRLISTRVETTDPSVPPYGTDPDKYPRFVRVRDLDGEKPQLLAEISDFGLHVFRSELTRDGKSLVVEGRGGPARAPVRLVKAFDIASRRELWTIEDKEPESDAASFRFDPTGRVLMRDSREDRRIHFLETRTCALLESYESSGSAGLVSCLGPGGQLRLSFWEPGDIPYSIRLWTAGSEAPLLTIANDAPNGGPGRSQFSLDGRYAIWGNQDGTVTVLEPEEVRRRLSTFNLGW